MLTVVTEEHSSGGSDRSHHSVGGDLATDSDRIWRTDGDLIQRSSRKQVRSFQHRQAHSPRLWCRGKHVTRIFHHTHIVGQSDGEAEGQMVIYIALNDLDIMGSELH